MLRPLRALQGSNHASADLFVRVPYPSPTPVYNIAFFHERLMTIWLEANEVRYLAFRWTAARRTELTALRAAADAVRRRRHEVEAFDPADFNRPRRNPNDTKV